MKQIKWRKVRVGIFQYCIPNYREAVFRRLAESTEHEFEFVAGKAPRKSWISEATPGSFPWRVSRVISVSIPRTKNSVTWQTKAVSAMLSHRYDVLITIGDVLSPNVWLCCLLSRLLRIPVCIWGQGISRPPSRFRNALRYALTSLATAAVYYSEGGKDYWVKRGIPARKLFVAYNALDTEEQTRIRDSLTAGEMESFLTAQGLAGKKIVTYLGRLIAVKKPAVFIDAVARAAEQEPNLVGLVLGDGPQRRDLEKRAREKGVGDAVRFVGETYDEGILARYLTASAAVVLPAAAGLAIQHAAVYGAPLILGDVPNHHLPEQEIVEEGKTGLWCPDEDIDAFASAILRLTRDEPFRATLSANVRREIDEKYNVAKMAQGFIDAVRYCLDAFR